MRVGAGLLSALAAGGVLVACGGESPHVEVTPTTALFDVPLTTTVTGLARGQDVTLRLDSVDATGGTWTSSAVFRADAAGEVSTRNAPTSGSYTGARPMGLVETLSPGHPGRTFVPPTHWTMTVSAVVDGTVRAHTTVTREPAASAGLRVTAERPASSGIYGTLYLPAPTPAAPRPAVVAFGGAEGGLSTDVVASALAAHGYPALALAYFDEPGLPADLERIPLEYFATAVRLLATRPGVDPGRIVLWGATRGSEAALLTAALYPGLVHAVVGAVPGSQASGGMPDVATPAWTFGGLPVPTASAADRSDPGSSAAAIPVEQISGPILLECGGQDAVWNSCADAAAIGRRLAAHGVPRAPTVLAYPGAGHLVGRFPPYLPSTSTTGTTATGTTVRAGGTFQADQAGRADAWPKLLDFLAALEPR